MTDLDKLREKAQAATPGPWRVRLDAHSQDELSTVAIELAPLRWFTVGYAPDADADYIAAADPTTVLALIDRLQRVETALREVAFWMEVECEHPREDPHPAMAAQARIARAALEGGFDAQ